MAKTDDVICPTCSSPRVCEEQPDQFICVDCDGRFTRAQADAKPEDRKIIHFPTKRKDSHEDSN